MREFEFKRMIEIKNDGKDPYLKVGDFFMEGINMITQKQNKKVGDAISYYEVISINNNGSMEFAPVFDYLEK